jgi:TP901 family phage tail tape measure protein
MAELSDIQLRIIVQGTGLENLTKINDTLGKVTGAIGASSAAANNAKGSWDKFRDSLSELERKFDAVFRAASHLQALGRDLTGMGEAGIGFLQKSVEAWGEYEFAVHRAAGALGIFDTTTPIFFNLQKAIDDVAQEARLFPAEDIARAVYFWGSATGQTVSNNEDLAIVMKGLLPILQTAAITETDVEKAIKGTYQIIQQYNLGLTRMADAQDVAAGRAQHVGEEISNVRDVTEKLMMITQNTAVEYTDLIEAFRYTGTIAPALGVKYEDLLLVLGRLGDMGIRGSQAGRALQQMFTQLLDPTVRASKALDEAWMNTASLGKSFDELVFPNGEFVGITELIDQMAAATENMTDKQRGELLGIITTQNELRALVPLIEDQIRARKEGISVYEQEKFNLDNASAQFEETMHLLEISWKGTMGYLTNSIGQVVRAIGSTVASMARPFVEQLGHMFLAVRKWLDTHPEIVEWGVKLIAIASIAAIVAGAIFTALGVLLAFGAGVAFVIKGISEFAGVFPRFFPIIGALIVVITALATNFGGLRDAAEHVIEAIVKVWEAMDKGADGGSLAMLDNLGKVIMPALETVARGVAAALEGVAWILERIAESPEAVKVVEGMVTVITALLALGAASRIAAIGFSILTLGGNGSQAAQGIRLLIDQMIKFGSLRTLLHPIKAFKDLTAAIQLAGDGMKTTASNAAGKVTGAFSSMAGGIATAAKGISWSIKGVLIASGIGLIIIAIGLLVEAWVNNWGDIQGKFAAVVAFIGGKLEQVGKFIQGIIDWFGHLRIAIGMRIHMAAETVRDAIDNIINFFRSLPGNVVQFVEELVTNVTTWFSTLWNNITTWVGNIVNTIIALPGLAWQGLVDGFNNILTFLGEWWTSLGDSTAERIGFIIGFIIALPIRGLIVLVEGFATIWNFFVEWWEGLMASIGEWVSGIVATIVDWISKLPGHIADWFGQTGEFLINWWNKLMADIGVWVSGVVNTIVTWISQLPGKFMTFLGQVWNNVSTWWTNFIASVGVWANNTLNAVINWIKLLPGRVMEFFGTLFSNVSTWFTGEFVPNIGVWTNNAITAVVNFFRELPGRVMKVIDNLVPILIGFLKALPGNVWQWVVDVGSGIVRGVWQGITGMWDWFKKQVGDFFKGIVNGVKSALGISSPSKVFAEIGTQMVQGLGQGIDRNKDAVMAMESQVQSLIGSARELRSEEMSVLGGDFSMGIEGEKKLTIEHKVSSPDGTVNAASRETIREIFTADEFVSALEHMATVG